MTDWEQHTKDQAEEITTKKRQLADALAERDNLRAKLSIAETTVDRHARQIDEQGQAITRQGETIDEQRITIASHEKSIERADTEKEQLSTVGRTLLARNSETEGDRKKMAAEVERLMRVEHRLTTTCILLFVLGVVLAIGWVIWLA